MTAHDLVHGLASVRLLSSPIIWTAVLVHRYLRSDPTVFGDLCIVGLFDLWHWLDSSKCLGPRQYFGYHYTSVFASAVWIILHASTHRREEYVQQRPCEPEPDASEPWSKPLVLPCRTTHARSFPQKHSFSYSYLYVGVPVGWQGCAGSLLSADSRSKRGWLHVDAADYLERDLKHMDLREKLDHYLRTQEVDPAQFPFAYLATAPRIFRYSFNPVSFWYLYSAQRELRAMILEVNNTFDERRMYLLHAESPNASDAIDSNHVAKGREVDDRGTNLGQIPFTGKWKKDFHVSPFNSRDGSYTLLARDPLDKQPYSITGVSNTIKLVSSQGHTKLTARIFSTSSAIDPSVCTPSTKIWLLLHYGWVGILTFPRIVKEAGTLSFSKKLPVFFRPEVMKNTISRQATSTERFLESIFARYLRHIVHHARDPICLIYKPAADTGIDRQTTMYSASCEPKSVSRTEIEIAILSPFFYSRFVHYAHMKEAIDREFLCTDVKNQTILVNNPKALDRICEEINPALQAVGATRIDQVPRSPSLQPLSLDHIRWNFLRWARCAPALQSYPSVAKGDQTSRTISQDIRSLPFSPMDIFVQHYCTREATMYRRKVTKLFLAQRFTAGFPVVVTALDWMLRLCLGYISVTCSVEESPIPIHHSFYAHINSAVPRAFATITLANALHIWSILKGL